jgi:L-ascorbate metabolism protein UlaG (beta-lactamase superfamily)
MATTVTAGFATRIGDFDISVVGGRHAINHDQIPPLGNVGFLVDCQETTVFHPGDSYDVRPDGVDLLCLPLNAPWCRMSETLDFLHAVAPRVAVPIHTGLLNDDGLAAYLMHVRRFGPPGCEVVALDRASAYDI